MIIESLPNRNETLTVTCSHSAETVEFRYGFKLLRLALPFHIFSCRYRVNATPKRKNFVAFSNSALGVGCSKPVSLNGG